MSVMNRDIDQENFIPGHTTRKKRIIDTCQLFILPMRELEEEQISLFADLRELQIPKQVTIHLESVECSLNPSDLIS